MVLRVLDSVIIVTALLGSLHADMKRDVPTTLGQMMMMMRMMMMMARADHASRAQSGRVETTEK